jgi:hypothetical protein
MHSIARVVRRWLAANQSATSFASKIPTITEPTGDGILDLRPFPQPWVKLWPILLGAENDMASLRIIGWHSAILDTYKTLWFPSVIGEFACTAGTAVGIAGAAVLNTERFADTITPVAARTRDEVIAAGTAIGSKYGILSPTNDLIAHVIMPIAGFEKLELTSDETTGTPAINALYAFLDC